ncbi:hypothetical protein GCM10017691_50440 [Pseudonocardia petroleophila]|uniref:Uncharacterized protein n=1 Tax=Pseudonocardia petroleophila TaxID=37331 RepID=A0A7G7MPV5_9PSEU|nr:hypothetical protein [Pseudonocardia petroleophila]QNG54816.1 hypothetical protein H6H00_13590 [Pseudonocardia petroleophila]
MSAAREYKAVVEGLSAAAAELREQDAERATALGYLRVTQHDAMTEAAGRAGLTRAVVALHWETALERLWQESWLTLRPPPAPTPGVDPARLDELDAEVARCADVLQEVTRRRRFGLPGR